MKHALTALILAVSVVAAPQAQAQKNFRQERLVYDDRARVATELPGVRLIRKGDSLLLAVRLINDSLQPERRQDELKKTLAKMLEAAEKDTTIELSVVDKEGYVSAVNSIQQNVNILGSNAQRGMSHIDIRLKTAIPDQSIDGQALVQRLSDFVEKTETVGRTVVTITRKADISILNPEQYRGEIIKLIAAEINLITGALGGDYKVILEDLEKPLAWRRTGIVDVELYIPYRFKVIPGSVTSVQM